MSYIVAALESPCTTLYRPLIVTSSQFSTVSEIAGFVRTEPIFPYRTVLLSRLKFGELPLE